MKTLYEISEEDILKLADAVKYVRKINVSSGLPEFCLQAHVPKYGWCDVVEGTVGFSDLSDADKYVERVSLEIAKAKGFAGALDGFIAGKRV